MAINLASVLTQKSDKIDMTFFERRAIKEIGQTQEEDDDDSIFRYQGNAMSTIHEALRFEVRAQILFTMANMPPAILGWLYRETGLVNHYDIEFRLREASEGFPDSESHSLVRSAQILMLKKGADTRAKKRSASVANEEDEDLDPGTGDTLQSTLPKIVKVYCGKCKATASEIDDTEPKWHEGKYIARKWRTCSTKGCCDLKTYVPKGNSKQAGKPRNRRGERIFVPVDPNREWISYNLVKK